MDRRVSMQIFAQVVALGSFAAAAGELGLSPTMVAKHIHSLERAPSGHADPRATRRQSLTDVGLSFLERCRLILAGVGAAENLATAVQKRVEVWIMIHVHDFLLSDGIALSRLLWVEVSRISRRRHR